MTGRMLIGIMIIITIFVVAGFMLVWKLTRAATDAADRWLALVVAQEFDQAHAQASSSLQRACTTAELRRYVQTTGLAHAAPKQWWTREYYGKKGMVVLVGGYPLASGGAATIAVNLQREGEDWKVESLRIGADVAQSVRRRKHLGEVGPGLHVFAPDTRE